MILYRNISLSNDLELTLKNGLTALGAELINYVNNFGAKLEDITERQMIGFLLNAMNNTSSSLGTLITQEIKCNGNSVMDMLLIDKNNNYLAFESKNWAFNGMFRSQLLLNSIVEFQTKLKTIYIPNIPLIKPKSVVYSPLLFEHIMTPSDLSVFQNNINTLFNSLDIDFYYDYIINNEAIAVYGKFDV